MSAYMLGLDVFNELVIYIYIVLFPWNTEHESILVIYDVRHLFSVDPSMLG